MLRQRREDRQPTACNRVLPGRQRNRGPLPPAGWLWVLPANAHGKSPWLHQLAARAIDSPAFAAERLRQPSFVTKPARQKW